MEHNSPRGMVCSHAFILRHDMACTGDLPVPEARTSRLFPLLDYLSGDECGGIVASLCRSIKQCGTVLLFLRPTIGVHPLQTLCGVLGAAVGLCVVAGCVPACP